MLFLNLILILDCQAYVLLTKLYNHSYFQLFEIINSSIDLTMFPEAWNVSRISPIPKNETPTKNEDLRPIAILPVLSKVYEKIVATQMVHFLETNKILDKKIVGYRKGHSTLTALLKIPDDIIRTMKKGELILMVMVVYSKAFDTVNFKIVLRKMHHLGLYGQRSGKMEVSFINSLRSKLESILLFSFSNLYTCFISFCFVIFLLQYTFT